MDAAAQPASEAISATPETSAPEPGARWKALPYKKRKKIENAAGVAVLAVYFLPLIAWGCWANAQFVILRRPPPEAKLFISDLIGGAVALGFGFILYAGYQYLRHVSSNKDLLWDGIRGYYHKWRTHRNNARSAVAEMAAEPALRPEKDVRGVASTGRDALVFGVLAIVFAGAAAGLMVCDLLGVFHGTDGSSEPYSPGEVFALVAFLAAAVLAFVAAAKGGTFVSAWRRFVFASAKRGVLGWWREFSASDDWKRFVSIRLTFTIWRCTLFVLLLTALVWSTHEIVLRGTRITCEQILKLSNRRLATVCPLGPFRYFATTENNPEEGGYSIAAEPEAPSFELLAATHELNWYLTTAYLELEQERRRKAELLGWTGERMAGEIQTAAGEIDSLRRQPPITPSELETLMEPLQMEGFSWSKDEDGILVKTKGRDLWFGFSGQLELRVAFDGGRLVSLRSGEDWENFECYDFTREFSQTGGLRRQPVSKGTLPPLKLPTHLTFWLAIFTLPWSLLLAPLLFLRFTYDPDKERAQQTTAAAPATAPFSPPST